MRLLILAVGHGRGSHEGGLAEDYVERAQQMGKRLGIADVAIEEVPVSKAREVAKRKQEEAERLAARVPDAAQVICLDA
ncbi:MAG: 23S rRNA (pseudouridine(1915)-N(3))-methyltransferase RlmH, partial [Alphaproteobacteria bacterium]|nr:23S rRNA (pseudouridine(1915)-N(3))-methyltransferase RlmH [Alphaproteobacteria bacterium]